MTRGAPKGNKFATGRPKGKPNAATLEFKVAVSDLLKYAAPQIVAWLEEIEDPSKRLEHVYKFAQFGFPLLARTDVQNLDKDGKPADNTVTVRVIGG